jgi:23S rRNA (cytidine2498-2'-O)-methyltransferase
VSVPQSATAEAAHGAPAAAKFLFATCQVGAEPALKVEVARRWPEFRFAYSRPGFLTFKLPPDHRLPDHFDLQATFARGWGFSLGKTSAADPAERRAQFWSVAGSTRFDTLHVWQRDRLATGDHGYEPGLTDLAREVADSLVHAQPGRDGAKPISANATALPGQLVLDCVLVEPDEWWIGYHRAQAASSCWPGGLFDIELPAAAVSRAYAKIEEALAWSGLPIRRGDRVVEIGCAPGGASQALLGRGLFVTGIDPADVDPRVLAHPRFTHLRKRGADVRRREFRGVRWLMADMNVAPAYTLTTVGEIVTHPAVKIAGMLLTLKLINWELADEVPGYLERVRSWGFTHVAARQLAHNRQEICVAARRKV